MSTRPRRTRVRSEVCSVVVPPARSSDSNFQSRFAVSPWAVVLVVGIVAWTLYGERPTRAILVALPIVIAGVALIAGLVGADPYGAAPLVGVVMGLFTALSYAGYLIVIRRGEKVTVVGDGSVRRDFTNVR